MDLEGELILPTLLYHLSALQLNNEFAFSLHYYESLHLSLQPNALLYNIWDKRKERSPGRRKGERGKGGERDKDKPRTVSASAHRSTSPHTMSSRSAFVNPFATRAASPCGGISRTLVRDP